VSRQSYNVVPFVTMEQKKSWSWNIKTHYLRFKHFIITINGFLVSFFLKIFHKNDFQVTSDIYVCTCFFLIDYVEGFLYLCQRMSFIFFSSPDPKGHVSYCHHLAVVVRRKLFQKSSPLKVLDQWKPSLWHIRRKVLKFYKFDEKRAITPRWVIRFTSKLQGR
jgi:hypothetical protein